MFAILNVWLNELLTEWIETVQLKYKNKKQPRIKFKCDSPSLCQHHIQDPFELAELADEMVVRRMMEVMEVIGQAGGGA